MSIKQQAIEAFVDVFQYQPEYQFHAPGRVNLIGEHTDYNDGFVLPAAINFGTVVSISKRNDNVIRACAVNFNNEVTEFQLSDVIEKSVDHSWSNYLRGVCQILLQENIELTGADLTIVGDVPYGAGLSSSAALEIVLIRALTALAKVDIDPTRAALLGQKTENEYIGANTGIMDQLICACGQENHAVLIDCRTLESKPIALSDSMSIVIINSNVKRGLVDSEYNQRREQCQEAANSLKVSHLRDATLASLENAKANMSDVAYRRARHVISENNRTLEATKALSTQNWPQLGKLMAESHISMRDDFEITVAPIDGIVEMVGRIIGQEGGVRMTGGGFGGCVVALVPSEKVTEVTDYIRHHYQAKFGIKEDIYICKAVDGAFMA